MTDDRLIKSTTVAKFPALLFFLQSSVLLPSKTKPVLLCCIFWRPRKVCSVVSQFLAIWKWLPTNVRADQECKYVNYDLRTVSKDAIVKWMCTYTCIVNVNDICKCTCNTNIALINNDLYSRHLPYPLSVLHYVL